MKKKKKADIFSVIGLLLIAAALFLAVKNINEDKKAGETAETVLLQLQERIEETAQEQQDELPLYEEYEEIDMPQITVDGYRYIGVLSIPSLGLELPVKGEFSYPALTGAPCRYSGSVYANDMIIAGHNYKRHFGRLGNVKLGDPVSFKDADGNVFNYEVLDIMQLMGSDTEGMQAGDWDMTLFTCTLSGRQRITVRLGRI